jgi:Tol biopolymer transport system component/imidazolonepropionase-like amidohydrolase
MGRSASAIHAGMACYVLLASSSVAAAAQPPEKWSVEEPPGTTWRTIDIDTTQTTWSDVEVSPDGRTILFDMLGDLYTLPIAGGEARALTESVAWDIQPRFSPDGRHIAFISDRGGADNIWVMQADGSDARAVTAEREHTVFNPAWGPDGQYLLGRKGFMSSRTLPAGEIWLFHVGGGEGLQLVPRRDGDVSQKNIAEPVFSRDGRYVYFSQDETPGAVWQYLSDSTPGIFAIKRLDRETGEVEVIVSGPGGAIRPLPSPNGKLLAFVKRSTRRQTSVLYLKDLSSGREWPIYEDLDRDLQETAGMTGNTPAFAWMPDGSAIVFWAGGQIRRIDVRTAVASVIPLHVKARKRIAPALRYPHPAAPDSFAVRMVRWAQYSPDGRYAVFQALGHLYLREIVSGKQRRLTTQSDHFEMFPSFSRDSRYLVYTTWDDRQLGSIKIIGVRGGSGRVVTQTPGHYVDPRFSPDGRTIVYRKVTGGYLTSDLWSLEPGIYTVPAAGGAGKRVIKSGTNAHFGAAGDRIYFSTAEDDMHLALKSVTRDGLDLRTHLKGTDLTELNVSPDGKWVAFAQQYKAYIAPFAPTGKTVDLNAQAISVPVRQVSNRAGEVLHWSADASRLHWSHGVTLYTRQLRDAFAAIDSPPRTLPDPVDAGLDLSFQVAADKPSGAIALTGARIVTMRNAAHEQEVIAQGTIVVRGNRIEAVGAASEVPIPADAHRIDVVGSTIIPGLVDVHAHGAMSNEGIIPQQNWIQYSNLSFGVTTIHDPASETQSIFATAELQRAGTILAPRIFSAGTNLYAGYVAGVTAQIDSYHDALFHVRRMQDAGAISVKSYQFPRREQRQQLIAAARELRMMVVPEGGANFQANMSEIVDGHTGIEHSLPLGRIYEDVLQLWAQSEVGYTPTLGVAYGGVTGETYWYEHTNVWEHAKLLQFTPRFVVERTAMRRLKVPEEHYNFIRESQVAQSLMSRGVSVQLGAHGQREGLAAHWELWLLEQGGFTPWQALRAGTIAGARYIGLDADIGSIERGKLADLAVIKGDPLHRLRDSEQVTHVMINGRLYDAATMDEIAPGRRKRQPLYFETAAAK